MREEKRITALLACIAVSVGILVLDLRTPLGFAEWLLYLIPMLLAFRFLSRRQVLLLCSFCTFLMAIGFVFSPPGGMAWDVGLFNRVVGAGVLWLTSVFIFQRKRMEARLEHVNRVLRAIRRANQLIVVEKDRDALTTGICNLLTEARAYLDVWVALLDDSGNLVATAESGVGSDFLQLVEQLKRHEFPYCVQRAMKQSSLVVIEDPVSTCADCPLARKHVGRGVWTTRMEHAGRIYGVATASVLAPVTAYKEEQELFKELAGDLAMALTGIRLEQERKRMEDALTESENRYRTLFDSASDAILIHDMGRRFLEVNQVACERLGYSREELLQMTPKDIQAPGYGKAVENRVDELKRVEHAFFETAHLRRDGAVIPIELSSRIIQYKGKPAVLSIARDITERKRAEEELKRYTDRLEELVEVRTRDLRLATERLEYVIASNPAVIYSGKALADYSDWHLTYLSERVTSMLGYESRDFIGHPEFWERHIHPEDVRRGPTEMQRLWEEGQHTFEYRFLHKDGTYRWIREETKVIRDAAGNPVEVTGYWTDVTELKRLEAELVESRRLAAIGETTAMVGHDLRNPLQAIVSTLYLAKRELGSPLESSREAAAKPGLVDMLETIENESYYMNKIVSDLQDYATPLKPKPIPVEMESLVKDTLSKVRIPQTVKVSFKVSEALQTVMIDPAMLRRVFSNLIMNAIQAMPDGGELGIDLYGTDEFLFVAFKDTGMGMPEENIGKLFDPFFTTKAKGQGLGLPVCKRLVEACDGRITVESKPGEGSTFTVKLPFIKP